MTLVSAIYGHGPQTIIGGRGRSIEFYTSTLRNIANLELPLVLFTSPDQTDKTEDILRPYFKNNLKIISRDIEDFKYFDRFIKWKKEKVNLTQIVNDRNETLCYSKIFWLREIAESNFFSTEKFAWIDSGLFHHGIFPEAVGGVELLTNPPADIYYPISKNNIFTPNFGRKLTNRVQRDKMFFISTIMQGDTSALIEFIRDHYNPSHQYFNKHLVGGFFGSSKDTICKFADLFDDFLCKILDDEIYVYEEPVFSTIYNVYPELFDLESFYTWYFFSPGERTSMLAEDGDSFYKVFLRIMQDNYE
jgi:hypothetical protein